jgi:hypothetical protein
MESVEGGGEANVPGADAIALHPSKLHVAVGLEAAQDLLLAIQHRSGQLLLMQDLLLLYVFTSFVVIESKQVGLLLLPSTCVGSRARFTLACAIFDIIATCTMRGHGRVRR